MRKSRKNLEAFEYEIERSSHAHHRRRHVGGIPPVLLLQFIHRGRGRYAGYFLFHIDAANAIDRGWVVVGDAHANPRCARPAAKFQRTIREFMTTKSRKQNTFFFTSADSSDAAAILQRMTKSLNLPVLGLIVKVNDKDEVLNVELADEHTVKSLAIANTEVQK